MWTIPFDAEKPSDLQGERKQPKKSFSDELSYVIVCISLPMPANNPDSIMDTMVERMRLQYE